MMNKLLLPIFFAALFVGIAYGSHAPLVPVFAREEISATYLEIGAIGMANYFPYMFMPALVGILLDKFNRGLIMSIGIAISASSIFLLSLSNTVIDVMIIRSFAGLAHAFFWPAATSIVTSISNNAVKSVSRYTMFWVAGYMIGPLIGSLLFENFGFRLLFQYTSFIMLIALASASISIMRVKNRYSKKEEYSFKSMIMIMKSKIRVYILVMYYSASFGIVLAVLPAYIKENGINEFNIGVLFFIFGLARLITLFFTHKFADKAILIIVIATILIAFSMLIVYALVEFNLIALALIMFGFAFSIYFPITLGIATKNVSNDVLGRYVGSYETVFGIGWTTGPVVAGVLADIFTSSTPYLIMFIIGIILPIIMLRRFNSE
ncbi:MAG: MFS transporter [Candidatus Nitrosocaldaceae archaeon]|nr:MAG: MFS transporter [Candidatus Nitrosocaldaceae archaeon]